MSLEMAHKVIVPPKKNYIPQFLKQRDINSYYPNQFFSFLYISSQIKPFWPKRIPTTFRELGDGESSRKNPQIISLCRCDSVN
jgi:hypothetical protein